MFQGPHRAVSSICQPILTSVIVPTGVTESVPTLEIQFLPSWAEARLYLGVPDYKHGEALI